MSEVWKPVVGHEGAYEVSDMGNVRSVTRYVRLVAHGIETRRLSPGKMLRPGASRSGHVSVAIGKGNSRMVHQLVIEAFVGVRPTSADVAHNDGNPTNNTLANLRYATRTSNNQDFVRHGKTLLSIEDVHFVRHRCTNAPHGTQAALARSMGVSQSTISSVLKGRHYSYV